MSSSTFELPNWAIPQNMDVDGATKRKKESKEAAKASLPGFVPAGAADSSDEDGSQRAKKQVTAALASASTTSKQELPKLFMALLMALSSLSLSSAQHLRDVVGAMFLTFIAPATSPPVIEMSLAGQRYHLHHEEDHPEHIGPPYLHIFLALLQALMKHLPQYSEETRDALQKYWTTTVLTKPRAALAADAQFCKCKPTFHEKGNAPSHYKLQVRVQDPHLETALTSAIISFEGTSQKLGGAPRSGLERQVQRLLDQARKQNKK